MVRKRVKDNGLCASDLVASVKVETFGNNKESLLALEKECTGATDFGVGGIFRDGSERHLVGLSEVVGNSHKVEVRGNNDQCVLSGDGGPKKCRDCLQRTINIQDAIQTGDTHVFGKKFQSLLDLINSSLSIHTLGSFQIKAFKHLSHTRPDSVHNSTKIVPLTSHLALQVVTRPVEKRTRLYGVISAEDNSLSEVLGSGNRYQSDECTRLNFGRTVIRDTRV